jgi:hypothetical protein
LFRFGFCFGFSGVFIVLPVHVLKRKARLKPATTAQFFLIASGRAVKNPLAVLEFAASSSRALLTLKPSQRRWTLNSTGTIQQTARNGAEQFSILWPGEECESKKALPSVVDCYFHRRINSQAA